MSYRIEVPGDPVPMPRHRTVVVAGRPRQYVPSNVRVYQEAILLCVSQAGWPKPLSDGPVAVHLTFILPRPAYMARRSKKDPSVVLGGYPAGRIPHIGRPDVDNLAKSVLDALVLGGYLRDDGQVVCLVVEKWIAALGEEPRTVVALKGGLI